MEYLVENTTREERAKIAKKALAISLASNEIPTEDTINIVKEYVDGKIELKEAQKKVIERYKKYE